MNWFCECRTTQRIRERKVMPGRERGIVGSEKGRRRGKVEGKNVCWTVHFYVCLFVFPSYTCGTYESLFLPWNIKGKG